MATATQPLPSDGVTSAPPSGRPSPPMDAATKAALASLLALGLSLRVWLSLHDDGIYWPDEIYQSLEPAHRLVFGYGLIPWEFAEGARNWAFPGLVAALLKVAALIGGDQPRNYLVAIRLAFSAIGMVTAWGTYRLARACGSERVGAAVGAAFFALAPPAIYFAPRALSETVSAAAVVFGFARALGDRGRTRDVVVGASLLGFSALLRIQNGIFCVGLVIVLLARRRWKQAGLSAAVLVAWAVVYGGLDWLTWGDWFHSAVSYLRFNIVEGKAAQWGVSENTYYLRVLWTSMPLVTVFAAPLALVAARRSPGLLGIVLVYLVLHSVVGHKELRFLLPILPLWFALAGAGLSWLATRIRLDPRWLAAPVVVCAAIAAARFHELTFGDLGQYEHERPTVSAYDDFGPVNRLLLAAHDQADLCGIEIEAAHLAWTGGATYLHRNVPIFSRGTWMGAGHYNYVIAFGRPADVGRIVATEGPLALVRLPRSTCVPDPTYQWKLP